MRTLTLTALAVILPFAAGCPSEKKVAPPKPAPDPVPAQKTPEPPKESGTGAGQQTSAGAPTPAKAPPEKTYTVRARLSELPKPPHAPFPNFHHEAIPDFVARDGTVSGMHEMQMALPLAEGVTLGELKVGDKVEFDLWVDWGTKKVFEIRRLVKLPDDTPLKLTHKSQGNPEGGGESGGK